MSWMLTTHLQLLLLLGSNLAATYYDTMTVLSPVSEIADDSLATASCPEGYSLIECRLSSRNSFSDSDGLYLDNNNGCVAAANGRSIKGVQVDDK